MKIYPDAGEVVTRGQQLFEAHIQALVQSRNPDDFLAIDTVSGDFETDADDMTAEDRLLSRRPGAIVFVRRVGDMAAHYIGGSHRA